MGLSPWVSYHSDCSDGNTGSGARLWIDLREKPAAVSLVPQAKSSPHQLGEAPPHLHTQLPPPGEIGPFKVAPSKRGSLCGRQGVPCTQPALKPHNFHRSTDIQE
ncbi:hypothetical protein E2320_012470 [Naja naja]|nr:hypothetical protein E2320_012470 [Naja naja]